MGWFGGSAEGSNSGLDLSGGGSSSSDYGSKLLTPSSELDLSDYSSSGSDPNAGGDIQLQLQQQQQKAMLMSAVSIVLVEISSLVSLSANRTVSESRSKSIW